MSNSSSKYASIYGAKNAIRPDQYLVELIIKRRADKRGVILPPRFWSNNDIQYKYWKNIFVVECTHSKRLFNTYDDDCIITAFNSFECRNVLSSINKNFEQVIQQYQEQKNIKIAVQQKQNIVISESVQLPTKPQNKRSKLSKLK